MQKFSLDRRFVGFIYVSLSACLDVLCVHTQALAPAEPPWTEARAAPHPAQSAPKAPLQGTAEPSTKLAAPCRKQISAWAQRTQAEEETLSEEGAAEGPQTHRTGGHKGPQAHSRDSPAVTALFSYNGH